MPAKNLSDTTPAAPSGSVNVKWQIDTGSGFTSAYVPSSGGSAPTFVREVPTGTLNGTNKNFTLSYTPNPAASLMLYLNGVEQVPTTDYTISAATITYVTAPDIADLMIAQYTH